MSELMEALKQIEKEKNISIDLLIEAIEKGIVDGYKKDVDRADNVTATLDRETGEISLYAKKEVVEEVTDLVHQISLEDAKMKNSSYDLGDFVNIPLDIDNFGRIAAQQARSVIVQKIKEGERNSVFNYFKSKERDIVTGVVQRKVGNNISISLDDKVDALLTENEQVKGEDFQPTERIKVYVIEVKEATKKGPKILISRTHPELVKRLFEKEVTEVADGVVEIKSISREAGSRSKIAVWSNDENVDPVGACVGVNGSRVNNIVNDLRGEKLDIVNWNEDPAVFIENALSPSKVVSVDVDVEEKSAKVIVPDYQLSLAIGKEGQNARLAARLTGYKIDIKSESQAGIVNNSNEDYEDDYDYDENENA